MSLFLKRYSVGFELRFVWGKIQLLGMSRVLFKIDHPKNYQGNQLQPDGQPSIEIYGCRFHLDVGFQIMYIIISENGCFTVSIHPFKTGLKLWSFSPPIFGGHSTASSLLEKLKGHQDFPVSYFHESYFEKGHLMKERRIGKKGKISGVSFFSHVVVLCCMGIFQRFHQIPKIFCESTRSYTRGRAKMSEPSMWIGG